MNKSDFMRRWLEVVLNKGELKPGDYVKWKKAPHIRGRVISVEARPFRVAGKVVWAGLIAKVKLDTPIPEMDCVTDEAQERPSALKKVPRIALKWEKRDLWVGLYWNPIPGGLELYFCILTFVLYVRLGA